MTAPDAILRITRADEVVDAVRAALASGTSLRLRGGGSKAAITQGRGRPRAPLTVLDLSGCSGITAYEPAELVLSLRAGTPLREVQALLAEHRQMLAFEPPDLGPLLGHAAGQGSIGGAVASGLAGPRRISAGNVRDHLLGFTAVSGRGESFKAGGRVIKNVTGYDLDRKSVV
jgi:glycolate oxidase FAD binding subunit